MFSRNTERSSVILRAVAHLHAWNVLQGYVSQHSMPDLHDKEGNDIMTKKINGEYCVSVDG